MSQVSRRSEVAYINGVPSTPGYLVTILWELSHVPRGLTAIAEAKQVQNEPNCFFVQVQKLGPKVDPKISLISFSRGSGPPLRWRVRKTQDIWGWAGPGEMTAISSSSTILLLPCRSEGISGWR